ncbi:MAG: hypothetical protein WBG92_02550 [Thiohalocapsa sp.]
MAPRPRRPGNRDLVEHVYPPLKGRRSYRYYDRRTGKIVSLQTESKALANERGRKLNAAIAEQMADLNMRQLAAGTAPQASLTVEQQESHFRPYPTITQSVKAMHLSR